MHCKSYSHFFSKKIQNICILLDINFNESLTNDIVSFEQLGPVWSEGLGVNRENKHNCTIFCVPDVVFLNLSSAVGLNTKVESEMLKWRC